MKLIRYRHGCRWERDDGSFSEAYVYAWTAHLFRWLGMLKWRKV